MDATAHNPLILPTTASASITPLFLRVLLVTKNLLLRFEPLMRKGVSEVDLHNALAAFSFREVAARRMGRKRAATLVYLRPGPFSV
jgi:hypothetical protein